MASMSFEPGASELQQDVAAPRRSCWRARLFALLGVLLIVAAIVLGIWDPFGPPTRVEELLEELEEVREYQQSPAQPSFFGELMESLFGGGSSNRPDMRDALEIQEDLIAIGPAAVPELIQALPEESEQVRGDIAFVLGQIGDPAARDLLIETLRQDISADVRKAAASALAAIQGPGVIAALTETLEQDSDAKVRAKAAWCLSNFSSDQVTALLLAALKDDRSPDVRAAAAIVLSQRRSTQVPSALIAAADDSVAKVRASAARALGRIGDRTAVPHLISMMKTDSECAPYAAMSLGLIRDRRATVPLIEMLDSDDHRLVGNAASALGELADRRATDSLIALFGRLDDQAIGANDAPQSKSLGGPFSPAGNPPSD